MEPEALDFFGKIIDDKVDIEQQQGSASTMAMLSIAVSLKRIADELCGNGTNKTGICDGIATAIEQSILSATTRG